MSGPSGSNWTVPDWPAAGHVKALFSTRLGGVSMAPYGTFNLGDHVGDVPELVEKNRHLLAHKTGAKPVFLKQVHGVDLLDLSEQTPNGLIADACWTQQAGVACTIMVADCLPILMTDAQGKWVAAAHAGWRGLAGQRGQGVLETSIERCRRAMEGEIHGANNILVWLGPCIGPDAFEVGVEVKAAFCDDYPNDTVAFRLKPNGRYFADLALLARLRLQRSGVAAIFGNDSSSAWCTHTQESLFFSHRRDAAVWGNTGRMAACIWLDR